MTRRKTSSDEINSEKHLSSLSSNYFKNVKETPCDLSKRAI